MKPEILNRKKTILLSLCAIIIVSVGLLAVVILPSFSPENSKKEEIKEKVSKQLQRKDFNIDQIEAESNGWYLVRIVSTSEKDKGNPAYVILQKQNNTMVVRLGPGTNFTNSDLDEIGVPEALIERQKPYEADPIVQYLPYRTDNYYIQIPNAQTNVIVGSSEKKKPLDVIVYEFPRTGTYATPQRKSQYIKEAVTWIESVGLNPTNYSLTAKGSLEND